MPVLERFASGSAGRWLTELGWEGVCSSALVTRSDPVFAGGEAHPTLGASPGPTPAVVAGVLGVDPVHRGTMTRRWLPAYRAVGSDDPGHCSRCPASNQGTQRVDLDLGGSTCHWRRFVDVEGTGADALPTYVSAQPTSSTSRIQSAFGPPHESRAPDPRVVRFALGTVRSRASVFTRHQ